MGENAVERCALISVWDKTGIVEFAQKLQAQGFTIISTGGTKTTLQAAGIPVTGVEEVTGVPEMLGGRVKTLHPAIMAGILARRQEPEDRSALAALGYPLIDIVVVNFYPFKQVVADGGATFSEAMENIDIGGPSMLRAAAKNHEFLWAVCDPRDYSRVLDGLAAEPEAARQVRRELALKAFRRTSGYDEAIAGYLAGSVGDAPGDFPRQLDLSFTLKTPLRYGENSHQRAAFYIPSSSTSAGVAKAEQLQGKELSFNNINDTNAALQAVREFSQPAVVALKHTNPCGVGLATEGDLAAAFQRAYVGDPVSIFGGIIACNRPVDGATAQLMSEIFLEVIVAGFQQRGTGSSQCQEEPPPAAAAGDKYQIQQLGL